MIKLLVYLRHYKKESIIGPLFKMTEAVFELFVPLVMASIIDVGIRNKDMRHILWMCAVLVLLGLLGLTCSLTAQYFAAKAAVGFGAELRNDMMRHINRFSYTEIDQVGTATLITRMTNDINQTQTAVNLALRLFLRAPFIVVGAVIMAFVVHPGLASIFVLLVPVLCIAIFGLTFLTIPLFKKVQKKLEQVLRVTRENLTGIRVVRAFAREEEERAEFDRESEGLKAFQLFAGKISALMNPVTYIIVNAAILIVLWFGGKEVDTGGLMQGELIALINYMMQILSALVAFAFLIVNFMKGVATASRVAEILEIAPTKMPISENVLENRASMIIELDGVSFAYAGAKMNALQSVSLQVRQGEIIGIIGGTGSGKSTLVNLIAGFYPVTEGTRNVYTDKLGIVPQQAVLFSGTVRDNMKWGKQEANDEEIWHALEVAQASEFIEDKQEGLDLYVSQGGSNLSGGQRQRLTIARALVGKPELLILDDSASALDFLTDRNLRKAIRNNTRNLTVFIVSQRVTTIKEANRILVMDEGEAVGLGTHEELRKDCPVYEEICLSQMSGVSGGDAS